MDAMSSIPVLAQPYFGKTFIVKCHASRQRMGEKIDARRGTIGF
jgi:hypothetical protein